MKHSLKDFSTIIVAIIYLIGIYITVIFHISNITNFEFIFVCLPFSILLLDTNTLLSDKYSKFLMIGLFVFGFLFFISAFITAPFYRPIAAFSAHYCIMYFFWMVSVNIYTIELTEGGFIVNFSFRKNATYLFSKINKIEIVRNAKTKIPYAMTLYLKNDKVGYHISDAIIKKISPQTFIDVLINNQIPITYIDKKEIKQPY